MEIRRTVGARFLSPASSSHPGRIKRSGRTKRKRNFILLFRRTSGLPLLQGSITISADTFNEDLDKIAKGN
jgi:hypothetical protein|tara:strand:- start:823 stop:1035 length:213 start_codon:yes stop_codon:yes gene_type:complete